MVKGKMFNEIQAYKQIGYTIRKCARVTGIDRKTVRKYWNMNAEEYLKYLAASRERTKILDPYREEIISELETYPDITSAIIYDHLCERHEAFAPSYRSVRLYVMTLREELGIPTEVKVRQYTEVSEQPPGFQAQVDMGQKVMTDPLGSKIKIYIFAMVVNVNEKVYHLTVNLFTIIDSEFVCHPPSYYSENSHSSKGQISLFINTLYQ